MYYFFVVLELDFECFLDGNGGFIIDLVFCCLIVEDMVIFQGVDIVWEVLQVLCFGLVIFVDVCLMLQCELSLFVGVLIMVENGGEFILESGKLYMDCLEGCIEVLQVVGWVVFEFGSVIESIRQVKIESIGLMEVFNIIFVNCGLLEGMFCGENGNICE